MGIYNRDNINYSSMLMAALKDRAETAAREAAYKEKMGKIWGDATKSVGNMVGRGIMASADYYGGNSTSTTLEEDKAELAKLEEEQKKYNEQVEQRKKFDEIFNNPNYDAQAAQSRIATNEMNGYTTEPFNYDSYNASALMKGYVPAEANPYTRGTLIYETEDYPQTSVPLGYTPNYGIYSNYKPTEDEELYNNPYSIAIQPYYRRGH